jgi:hypothetical protein
MAFREAVAGSNNLDLEGRMQGVAPIPAARAVRSQPERSKRILRIAPWRYLIDAKIRL